MTTQSLRGIIGTEPLHWRGDTTELSGFNPAFMSLLGGPRQLTDSEMADFKAFIQTLTYPPNPYENLDRTYPDPPSGPSAVRGEALFNGPPLDAGIVSCNVCHSAVPGFGDGTNRLIIPAALLGETQDFKVPQLRGMYQKVGMQSAPGSQLSGFGFIHDGSIDTILDFLREPVFQFTGDDERRDVEAYIVAFDTGTAPAVGLQATVNADNKSTQAMTDRITLLVSQADAGNCDLVVRGLYGGAPQSFLYAGAGMFQPSGPGAPVSWQTLVQSAGPGAELTFTGVPVGAGQRFLIPSGE